MYYRDTIAAISTPTGNGGIGIIRISGSEAAVISDRLFKPLQNGGLKSHRFYFGSVIDPQTSEIVDECMAVIMRAPNSYTREDVLELHCHGGMLVVEKVLELALRSGARLADPGEFTKRAFLNGRIDLVQAEAVMDIIASKTDAALKLAQRQREGLLSSRVIAARDEILHALALIEAYIDFPEEDIGDADMKSIVSCVTSAKATIQSLLNGFDDGRTLREGISVLIIGKPNVGKSSLLNRLLNENRAIVTHIAGTTRDIIEETVNMDGLPVRLLDTAGIRHTNDEIEQEGIYRALDKIPLADLVLFVVDSSRPFDDEDQLIQNALSCSKVIYVANKCDLPQVLVLPDTRQAHISASNGDGIDQLKALIRETFLHVSDLDNREFIAISHVRHRDALCSALTAINRFESNFDVDSGLELLAVDLRDALSGLAAVTGESTNEDLLDVIFSSFCIGK